MDPTIIMAVQALKDLNASYVDTIGKVIGFQLVAIGWMLTSDKARSFLSSSKIANSAFLLVGFICLLGHSAIVFRMFDRCRALVASLATSPELSHVIAAYELTPVRITANYIAVFGLFAVLALIGVVLRTHREPG